VNAELFNEPYRRLLDKSANTDQIIEEFESAAPGFPNQITRQVIQTAISRFKSGLNEYCSRYCLEGLDEY
jgi:hypothetical protein